MPDVFKLCLADVSLNHLILLSTLLSSFFPQIKISVMAPLVQTSSKSKTNCWAVNAGLSWTKQGSVCFPSKGERDE